MNWEARAKALQREVDELEFRVENLESALSDAGIVAFAGLTGTEEKVAQLLRKRSPQIVTKQQILDFLYAFRSDGEQPEIKIVDAFICKIRPKLAPFAIEVATVWGRGYAMTAAGAAAWDAHAERKAV